MTVANEDGRTGPYNGNGSTTVFAYDFKILDESHIVVTLTSSAGVETVQTITSQYTVSGVGNDGGGNVTMVTAPASGETLTFSRSVPKTQLTDLQNRGGTQPQTLETMSDKLTQITQDLAEIQARTFKAPVSDSSPDVELPVKANRASKLLGFDSNGDISMSATVALPSSLAGQALNMLRANAGESAYEFRTPAEVLTDISGISASSSDTLSNKTIALGSNTISGTTAQFNTALSDGSFATLAGTETLTNKTINGDNNTISNIGAAELSSSITYTGTLNLSGATVTYDTQVVTLTGTQTLTNKTLTSPVLNTGVSGSAIDTDGTLASNSDTLIPSQQAVKEYVDTVTSASAVWNDVVYLTNANSPYNIETTDTGKIFSCDCSGGAITLNLPSIAGAGTLVIAVKKTDSSANAITVTPDGSETIDGNSNYSIDLEDGGARFASDEDQTPDDWLSMAFGPSGGNFNVDTFAAGVDYTKDSSTTVTLTTAPGTENNIKVWFDGVYQPHDTYTLSDVTVTFDAAIPADQVDVVYGNSLDINTPGDLTVTTAKLAADAVTGAKIADDEINSEHYVAGSIDLEHLANESKRYDIAFQAGIAADGTADNLAVQRYSKLILPVGVTFEDVEIHLDTAGTGQSVIFDIELNGTTIFTTRPECDASSQTEDGNHVFNVTTGSAGDYLEFHVDQIGSGTAGAGAAFTLKARLT